MALEDMVKQMKDDPSGRNRLIAAALAAVLMIGAFSTGLSIDLELGGGGSNSTVAAGTPDAVLDGDLSQDLGIDFGNGTTGDAADTSGSGGLGTSSAPSLGASATGASASGSTPSSGGSATNATTSAATAPASRGGSSSARTGQGGGAAAATAPQQPAASAPSAPADACAGATLEANDQGVSEDGVKLGVLVPNLNELELAGFPVGLAGDFDKISNAWVNELNNTGGVACRQVSWVKRVFDVVDGDDMLRVCKEMTQDEKVFSVVTPGGYDSVGQLCIAKDAQTPLVNTEPEPAEWYRDAAPYLWTSSTSKDRGHINHVRYLVDYGHLTKDSKIGVIYDGVPHVAPATEAGLLPELKRQGLDAKVFKLSADPEQAIGQINQVVIDFQLAGVDFVFMPMNLIYKTQFMQSAENQNYYPQYTDSDHNFGCFDFTTSTYPVASFDGTICVTASDAYGRVDLVEYANSHPFAQYAQRVYEASYPEGYHEDGPDSDGYLTQQALHISMGQLIVAWADAANRVGPALTRPLWGQAMGQTGQFTQCVCENPIFWGADKFDASTTVKGLRWHAEASDGFEERLFHEITRPQPAYVQRFIP